MSFSRSKMRTFLARRIASFKIVGETSVGPIIKDESFPGEREDVYTPDSLNSPYWQLLALQEYMLSDEDRKQDWFEELGVNEENEILPLQPDEICRAATEALKL